MVYVSFLCSLNDAFLYIKSEKLFEIFHLNSFMHVFSIIMTSWKSCFLHPVFDLLYSENFTYFYASLWSWLSITIIATRKDHNIVTKKHQVLVTCRKVTLTNDMTFCTEIEEVLHFRSYRITLDDTFIWDRGSIILQRH